MNSIFPIISGTFMLLLVGCTGNLNQVDGVMGTTPDSIPALVANPPSSIYQIEEPSLQGLDRRNWEVVKVAVPRGQVEVQPTYAENLNLATGVARDNGTYPTIKTALQGNSTSDSIVFEGIIEPFWPVALFVAAPVRMVGGEWPLQTKREPKANFELVPSIDSNANGVNSDPNWAWVENPKQQ
ncbi:MAG: hypothetical protein O2875_02600 [Planctomycetota bacterium]|nr:hypothetical protein [Planctomycetota bacterium]MDA1262282.1 hypothetical protein [Planctomycetota bacterium]